ncbi:MAG: response regulator transcription factor [Planctomycetota bacterium]|jgi:DNA-binding response OmpR family regulator
MPYILVVDDDHDFATAVSVALEEAGHKVGVESDPKSGMRSLEAQRPDLVVLDVMFPEDSTAGFEMARTIRAKFKDLPVLMLTAVNQKFPYGFSEGDIDDNLLPVSDFVEKPVDLDVLCRKVEKLLSPGDATS